MVGKQDGETANVTEAERRNDTGSETQDGGKRQRKEARVDWTARGHFSAFLLASYGRDDLVNVQRL